MMRPIFTYVVLVLCAAPFAHSALAESSDFNGDGRDDLVMNVCLEDIGVINNAGAVNVIYGSKNGLKATGDQFWHQDVAGVKGSCQPGAMFGFSSAPGDFNGDGRDDLAIGAPEYDVNGIDKAGAVAVLYGHSSGLRANDDQLLHRAAAGVQGNPTVSAKFGWNLAAGDFDGDGYDDLAVGCPYDSVLVDGGGSVQIFYGSPNGLTTAGDQIFTQNTPGIADSAAVHEYFGHSLIAGDFNGDGRDDLAIGAPGEDVDGLEDVGAVHVLFGSTSGLRTQGDQFFHQNTAGVAGEPKNYAYLGFDLAAGDFDNDGFDDLAIGIPMQTFSGIQYAGAVLVMYGQASGLSVANDQLWHQNRPGIGDKAEPTDTFGTVVEAGDFNGDGRDDLAISIPYEDVGGLNSVGAVAILYGSANGLRAAGDQFFHRNTPGVAGDITAQQLFGAAFHVGDFDGDGRDDLAVFIPYTVVNGHAAAGSVMVFYGSSSGISFQGEQTWHQDSPGILDQSEDADFIGYIAPGFIT